AGQLGHERDGDDSSGVGGVNGRRSPPAVNLEVTRTGTAAYSARRASIGSRAAARRAGRTPLSRPTTNDSRSAARTYSIGVATGSAGTAMRSSWMIPSPAPTPMAPP